ncbi:MAG: ABC transporter permease [Candidatus Paceibacterota bacterium]|jgi:ABC-type lipoprotein release transport system permease subunit
MHKRKSANKWGIGFYLAVRQVRRANKWTTLLIIAVMVLTFLNLVVISGILVGLIQGSIDSYRTYYTGDVIITNLDKKSYIEKSNDIIATIQSMPEIERYSARYVEGGKAEVNYKAKARETDEESTSATFSGIDPVAEDNLTEISKFIVEGEYLSPDDYDKVLVGSYFLYKYTPIEAPGFMPLRNVALGSKMRITIGDVTREVTIKGILKSKVDDVSGKIFMVDSQFRSLIGRDDQNVDSIAMRLKPGVDPKTVKEALIRNGFDDYGKVQTFEDAQPKFLKDITATFALLGNAIGSIGLAVASITIFIVIFINAITRRKFIGIMKGIGIRGDVIEISYVFQSIFYALCGSAIGMLVVFGMLVPFFNAHPIDFPFSDGILVATFGGTMLRVGLLLVTTIIAGYIPARMIVRKNTLDSILGRQ